MHHYSDPVKQISDLGWVRYYSPDCAVVAFEKHFLSDEEIGRHFEADITHHPMTGLFDFSINNQCEYGDMSRIFNLIEAVTTLIHSDKTGSYAA